MSRKKKIYLAITAVLLCHVFRFETRQITTAREEDPAVSLLEPAAAKLAIGRGTTMPAIRAASNGSPRSSTVPLAPVYAPPVPAFPMGAGAWGGSMAAPMDMSGLINNQVRLQALGDQMATQAAWTGYERIQDYRQQTGDYTTPSMPVDPRSLQQSIAGANAAAQDFIRSGAAASASASQGSRDWSTRAIRGENEVIHNGRTYRVDGSMTSYYVDRYGVPQGTRSESVPNGATRLTPRW